MRFQFHCHEHLIHRSLWRDDCWLSDLFWAKAFPQISCPQLKKAGETLICQVAPCDWLKLDNISSGTTLEAWWGAQGDVEFGITIILRVQWSNDPMDFYIRTLWMRSSPNVWAAARIGCLHLKWDNVKINQEFAACSWTETTNCWGYKRKRFIKAIKGGLYQEFEVMLSISSAIDCSVCRFYHSNSSEGRVQQLRDPHLHAHGWQRQGETETFVPDKFRKQKAFTLQAFVFSPLPWGDSNSFLSALFLLFPMAW